MENKKPSSPRSRAEAFANRLGIRLPILLAPMAGACPTSLAVAVANAGGMGACGAVLMKPEEITAWSADFRRQSKGQFQLNLWIPDPPAVRDAESEKRQREYLATWGPPVPPEAGNAPPPDFESQCQAALTAAPKVISSIMGLYPPAIVAEMKTHGILWFATATTVTEARAAEAAGADAIVAQGMEAGGHRGAFRADDAVQQMVGLIALVPQIADAVAIPVVAAGGISDARAVAASLILGASAVMIGTGLLRTPESQIYPAYATRLGKTEAHETIVTRAFTGRPGRSIATTYALASTAPNAPPPAPYPIQRALTHTMREDAAKAGDSERMQMWAGQSARLARTDPAGTIVRQLWDEASQLLP
jgi:nitronate monooxygenase